MKNPPRFRTHLEGWRPTVALAGHIVVATFAGLRLVGGTVRSSQDASEQLTRQIVVSMCLFWTVVLFAYFSQASVRGLLVNCADYRFRHSIVIRCRRADIAKVLL